MKSASMLLGLAVAAVIAVVQATGEEAMTQAMTYEMADVAGKCNYKCPPHSKKKDKIVCCGSSYDCSCRKNYRWKWVHGERKCVEKPPAPTPAPIRCPGGTSYKNCCEGDSCYVKKFGHKIPSMLDVFNGDDDDAIENSDPDDEFGDEEEGDVDIDDPELVSYDDLTADDDEDDEETSLMELGEASAGSLRASVLSSLSEQVEGGCGTGYLCVKGTKRKNKHTCPANQWDCKCRCKGGRYMEDKHKCNCPPKPPSTPPPTNPKCEQKKCYGYNVKPYYSEKKGKCACKCKKGYAVRDGECKPKQCFKKTICHKKPEMIK